MTTRYLTNTAATVWETITKGCRKNYKAIRKHNKDSILIFEVKSMVQGYVGTHTSLNPRNKMFSLKGILNARNKTLILIVSPCVAECTGC